MYYAMLHGRGVDEGCGWVDGWLLLYSAMGGLLTRTADLRWHVLHWAPIVKTDRRQVRYLLRMDDNAASFTAR